MKPARPIMLSLLFCCGGVAAGAPTTQPVVATAPTTDQLMNQMLATPPAQAGRAVPAASPQPMVDATSGSGAVAPKAPVVHTLREGTYILNRVGRLERVGHTDQMQIVFASDSKTMKDPPMLVLPNLKLMSMENVIVGIDADVLFRVSGLVTEFKNRNYILLDKAVVIPAIEQSF